jgi:hypothetical protein
MESDALRRKRIADAHSNRGVLAPDSQKSTPRKRRKRRSGTGKKDSEKRALGLRLIALWKSIEPYRD